MNRILARAIFTASLLASPVQAEPTETPARPESFVLAFGSCLRQQEPQPVWKTLQRLAPDALVLGGDNIYSDTGSYLLQREPARIGKAYAELAANPDWAALRAHTTVFATWDDHDYGRNDGGADYPHKAAAKTFFMDFFAVPPDAPMRRRPGIYDAHWLQHDAQRLQIVLLDTRTFRSPLVPATPDASCPRRRWGQNTAADATVLGEDQWTWLAARLAEPAELHLLVSSIQVIPEEHCYEKWANFPRERARLLALLGRASAPVLILSGDRHLGEISRLPADAEREWPLVEITSSGLNSAGAGEGEQNRHRALPQNVRVDNFATLDIRRGSGAPVVGLSLRAAQDAAVIQEFELRYPEVD